MSGKILDLKKKCQAKIYKKSVRQKFKRERNLRGFWGWQVKRNLKLARLKIFWQKPAIKTKFLFHSINF